MSRWLKWTLVWVGLSMLSGCSSLTGKKDEEKSPSDSAPYVEPDPGQSVGLRKVWSRSVAGKPDKYMFHPGRFVIEGREIYVGSFQGKVSRLRWDDGGEDWETDVGGQINGGVAVDEQHVYAGTVEGDLVALSRKDGKEVWRSHAASSIVSAPTAAKGLVLFVTMDNHTYAVKADTGTLAWLHTAIAEPLVVMGAATPTVEGEFAFVGYSTGEVYGLKLATGESVWSESLKTLSGRSEVEMLQDVDAALVVYSRKIYAVNHQGNVVAFYPEKGARIWERPASSVRTPLAMGGSLFVATVEGELIAFGMDDGFVLWRTRVSDSLTSTPVFWRGRLVIGDQAGRVFSLDPNTGRVTGKEKIGDPLVGEPIVRNENIFFYTNDGALIRYE